MRLAQLMGYGMTLVLLTGCGNRFGSLNYTMMPGFARPVQAAGPVAAVTLPKVDIGRPSSMAFDLAGNLLVANASGGSLMAVTSRGEALEKADNLPDPSAVTVSRSGAVYVACQKDGSIVKMTTREIKRTVTGLTSPKGLAVASDESLFVTLPLSREIIEIKADGTRQTLWKHATWAPEQITVTAKDEIFVSVHEGTKCRLLQLDRKGKQVDEYQFQHPLTSLAADDKGRLLVATAAPDKENILVGELGWLDRNGEWSILAENVVRPMAVTVYPGGNAVYAHYDEAKHRYEIVSIAGVVAAPWLAGS
ncbi:MAG: hypothetical protein H7338_01115 [Candidatus Sericytochromatia bacterium]|nr:hypothetical protein [Candidatus Sericytochromatia bacterium]